MTETNRIKLDDEFGFDELVGINGIWDIYWNDSSNADRLNFAFYQHFSSKTAVYPKDKAVEYLGLKLCGEAGEVAQIFGKWLRGDFDLQDKREDVKKELGDVCWYISQICTEMGISLEDVFGSNLYKLFDRKYRGVLKGSGDNR